MKTKCFLKNFMMTAGSVFLFCWLLTALPRVADAQDDAAIIELFSYGEISRAKDAYVVGLDSAVFVKIVNPQKERCLLLDKPGSYPVSKLKRQVSEKAEFLEFVRCNLLALVYRLKEPEQMVVTPAPRGEVNDAKGLFEKIWIKVAEDKIQSLPFNNVLASAFWFARQGDFARSAYILELLHRINKDKQWVLDLHYDAYSKTSMAEIEKKISDTQKKLLSLYSNRKNFALLIGAQDYGDNERWEDLSTPLEDIRVLKRVLMEEFHFMEANISILENPKRRTVIDAFLKLKDKVKSDSNLLIYYAGHGSKDEYGGYFWIPSDAGEYPDNWINTDYILRIIKKTKTLHTLALVDSCSGGAMNSHRARSGVNLGAEALYKKTSRQLITSGGDEPVMDKYGSRHSAFAATLLDILKNQPKEQILSAEELFIRLQPRVSALSNQTPTYDRLPDSGDQWGQFYFIKRPEAILASDKNLRESPRVVSPIRERSLDAAAKGKHFLGAGANAAFFSKDGAGFHSFAGYNIFYNYKINSRSSLNIRFWNDQAKYQNDSSKITTTRFFLTSSWQKYWFQTPGILKGVYYGLGLGWNLKNNLEYKSDAGDVSLNREGMFFIPEIGWKQEDNYFLSVNLNTAVLSYYYKDEEVEAGQANKTMIKDYWKDSKNINQVSIQAGFLF